MGLSATEIICIVVVVVLLFGAKRIPEIARALGKASNEYKKAKDNLEKEANELVNDSVVDKKDDKKNGNKA